MIRILAGFLFLFANANLWSSYGLVRDFNKLTKQVTVVTPKPGIFRSGQVVYAFHKKRLKGQIRISRVYHTKAVGRLIVGEKLNRQNLVVRRKKDILKLNNKAMNKISFKDISQKARYYIVDAVYLENGKELENQTRKIALAQKLGVLKPKQEFYSKISTKSIETLEFSWQKGQLRAKRVTYKINKKTRAIETEQILAANILERLKPRRNLRGKKIDLVIHLKKSPRLKPKQR